jgi:DNA-binding winged helix-turn-helix (wHTH) protein
MTPLRDFDRLRFGHFEVDLGSGELFRNGRRVALQELPFQLLTALITSPGQLLKREDLIARFWPGSVISDDDSLNTAVRKIRLALGDDAKNPRYIETVGRRGYRFVMPVRPVERDQTPRRRL